MTWVIEQGAVGGVPLLRFRLWLRGERDGDHAVADEFVYFQGGGSDRTFLLFLQVGADGR